MEGVRVEVEKEGGAAGDQSDTHGSNLQQRQTYDSKKIMEIYEQLVMSSLVASGGKKTTAIYHHLSKKRERGRERDNKKKKKKKRERVRQRSPGV